MLPACLDWLVLLPRLPIKPSCQGGVGPAHMSHSQRSTQSNATHAFPNVQVPLPAARRPLGLAYFVSVGGLHAAACVSLPL